MMTFYKNKSFDKQLGGFQAMGYIVYMYSLYFLYLMFNNYIFVSYFKYLLTRF